MDFESWFQKYRSLMPLAQSLDQGRGMIAWVLEFWLDKDHAVQ